MKIIVGYPPNYDKIKELFNPPTGTVFAYGDTIYSPDNKMLSPDLLVHESVHIKQQGNDPEKWWSSYFVDAQFRLSQEAEAYKAQYKWFCRLTNDRNVRIKFLHLLATYLSSPTYGNLVTHGEAVERLKNA